MDSYLIIYLIASFAAGFIVSWIIRTISLSRKARKLISAEGNLEKEKLIKENLQKELKMLQTRHETSLLALHENIKALKRQNKRLDEDILLLQKSNEETEALLKAGLPAIHDLKLKLIQANNTIARYKGINT